MSDTTITTAEPVVETTEVVSEEAPKQGFLKRFAKAFVAKVTQAAKAVQSAFVRLFGDNETAIPSGEGIVRTFARVLLAIPKWIALVALKAIQAVVFFVLLMVTAVVTVLAVIVGAVVMAAALVVMTVFKIAQGIALICRTPYLLVRGGDCFATDWKGYLLGWTPRYFMTTSIQQVYYMQKLRSDAEEIISGIKADSAAAATLTEALAATPAEALKQAADEHGIDAEFATVTPATLTAHEGGKGKATPKQRQRTNPRAKRVELRSAVAAPA